MTARTLAKSEWQSYCDRISKGLTGKRAQVEVTGLRIGDHIEAKALPLFGITYDSKNDLLEIAMEGLDHLVERPIAISVDDSPEGLSGMEIVDSEGRRQILKLIDPPMLSVPS
jgi:hypothetical protein